jgi:hypothetical protein
VLLAALSAFSAANLLAHTGCLMDPNPKSGDVLANAVWDPSTGASTFAGFRSSSVMSSTATLLNGLKTSVVFRPWEYLEQSDEPQASACNVIVTNPPYAVVH